mmetsp:Transcript_26269/g.51571  ORF Transcript_26269/g.51571 Transcript_26269/m.51571 type:complete len:182 (-) Transcript_26269:527-1072(-)
MNNTPRHDNERRLNKQKMAAKQKDRLAWRCSAFLCVFLSKEKSKWKRQLKSHTTQGTTVPLCLFIEKKKKSGRDKKDNTEEEEKKKLGGMSPPLLLVNLSACLRLSPGEGRGLEGGRAAGRGVGGGFEEKKKRSPLEPSCPFPCSPSVYPLFPLCSSCLFFPPLHSRASTGGGFPSYTQKI